MDLWDPGIISILTLLCKRCNPSSTIEIVNKKMDNDASSNKLHHSNVLLTEQLPMSVMMFAWRECGDDWRDEPSTAEPVQPPSRPQMPAGAGAVLGVQFYYNNTSPVAEWSHRQMSNDRKSCHQITLSPPPHHCCHLSHEGEKWTVLRWNVETILGLSHFSIF